MEGYDDVAYGMGYAGSNETWVASVKTEGYDPPVQLPREVVPASEALAKETIFCQGCCDKMAAVVKREEARRTGAELPLLGRWWHKFWVSNPKIVLNGGHEEYTYQEWRGKVYNLTKVQRIITAIKYRGDLLEKGCPALKVFADGGV